MPLYVTFIQMSLLDFSVVLLTKSSQPHSQSIVQNKLLTPFRDRDNTFRKATVLVMLHDTNYSTKWSFSNNLLIGSVTLITKKLRLKMVQLLFLNQNLLMKSAF